MKSSHFLSKFVLFVSLFCFSLSSFATQTRFDLQEEHQPFSQSLPVKSVKKHQDNLLIYPDVAQPKPQPSSSYLSSLGSMASSVLDSVARVVVKGYGIYTVLALPFVNAVESNLRSGSSAKTGVMTNYYTEPLTKENCLPSFHNPHICDQFDAPEEQYSAMVARDPFLTQQSSYLEMEDKVENFLEVGRKHKTHKHKAKKSHKTKTHKTSAKSRLVFQPGINAIENIYNPEHDNNNNGNPNIRSAFIVPFYCYINQENINDNRQRCSVLLTKKMIIHYKNIQQNFDNNNWRTNTRNFVNTQDANNLNTFFMQGGGAYDFPGGTRRNEEPLKAAAIRELKEELLIHEHEGNNFQPHIGAINNPAPGTLRARLTAENLIPLSLQRTGNSRGIYYAWNVGNRDLWNALCLDGNANEGYQQRKNGLITSINNNTWNNNPAPTWIDNNNDNNARHWVSAEENQANNNRPITHPQAPFWPEMEEVECLQLDQIYHINNNQVGVDIDILRGLHNGVGANNPNNLPGNNASTIVLSLERLRDLHNANLLAQVMWNNNNDIQNNIVNLGKYNRVRTKLQNAILNQAEWPRRVVTFEVLNNQNQVVEADNNNRPTGISLSVRLQPIHNLYRDYVQFNRNYNAYINNVNNQAVTLENRAQQMENDRQRDCLIRYSPLRFCLHPFPQTPQEQNIRQKLAQTNTLMQSVNNVRDTEVLPFLTSFSEGHNENDNLVVLQNRINNVNNLLGALQNLGNPLNEENNNLLHEDRR